MPLAEVDLGRRTGQITEMGTPLTVDWLTDADAQPVARADRDERTGAWRLLARKGGTWQPLYSETALIDAPSLVSFGRDTSTVIISSHKSGEWEAYEIRLADGTISGPNPAYDADSVILDPRSKTVIGTIDVKLDRVDYQFFNARDAALWQALGRAYKGEALTLQSWSEDRSSIILQVVGPTNGVALVHVDRTKGKAEFLADRYPGLGPEQLNPVSTFTYKAGDGLEIPAYLTLPRDRPAKALPLIVLAHGGPASRDRPGFDWWAQALASRGYAVLHPQFRGSIGFGEAHLAAGFGQWGRKMQTDLSDGVRDLVAKGLVDASRVCIAGGSYGGYAAMAGVTLDAGVYRCASAVAGVSDLRRMLVSEARDAGGERNSTLRYWKRFMGASGADDTSLDALSPARLASRVSVPLQLIHGKDDTVVPIEQSVMMRDAMARAGKPVEYLELADEDHYLSRPATRIAMLEAQMAFLERHNPPY
jgi:dipeptidyl aminopeptidase/acylaminoacyl peptidase